MTGIGVGDRPGVGQQDVRGDPLERPSGVLVGVTPGVVDVERGAVVDQPRPAVPDEQVRVLGGSVRVRRQGVEPDDIGGERGIDDGPRRWPPPG